MCCWPYVDVVLEDPAPEKSSAAIELQDPPMSGPMITEEQRNRTIVVDHEQGDHYEFIHAEPGDQYVLVSDQLTMQPIVSDASFFACFTTFTSISQIPHNQTRFTWKNTLIPAENQTWPSTWKPTFHFVHRQSSLRRAICTSSAMEFHFHCNYHPGYCNCPPVFDIQPEELDGSYFHDYRFPSERTPMPPKPEENNPWLISDPTPSKAPPIPPPHAPKPAPKPAPNPVAPPPSESAPIVQSAYFCLLFIILTTTSTNMREPRLSRAAPLNHSLTDNYTTQAYQLHCHSTLTMCLAQTSQLEPSSTWFPLQAALMSTYSRTRWRQSPWQPLPQPQLQSHPLPPQPFKLRILFHPNFIVVSSAEPFLWNTPPISRIFSQGCGNAVGVAAPTSLAPDQQLEGVVGEHTKYLKRTWIMTDCWHWNRHASIPWAGIANKKDMLFLRVDCFIVKGSSGNVVSRYHSTEQFR